LSVSAYTAADERRVRRNRARHDRALEISLGAHAPQLERREITTVDRDGHEFRVMLDRSIVERDGARFIATRIREATPDLRAESAFGPGGVRHRAILDYDVVEQ
jgi:hypothetical protein